MGMEELKAMAQFDSLYRRYRWTPDLRGREVAMRWMALALRKYRWKGHEKKYREWLDSLDNKC